MRGYFLLPLAIFFVRVFAFTIQVHENHSPLSYRRSLDKRRYYLRDVTRLQARAEHERQLRNEDFEELLIQKRGGSYSTMRGKKTKAHDLEQGNPPQDSDSDIELTDVSSRPQPPQAQQQQPPQAGAQPPPPTDQESKKRKN
jgi:hypothetical protein